MSRDANIPLILWVMTAIVVHMAGGEGAGEMAQVAQDRAELRALSRGVRMQLHPADTTIEVLTDDATPTLDQQVAPPVVEPEKPEKAEDTPPDKDAIPVPPPPPPKPKVEEKKPDEKKAIEEKKPEEKKPEEKKPEPLLPVPLPPPTPPPPPPPPLPPQSNRIAIKQNVAKDQPDNATAARIADEANTVAEETMAKLRARDQDDPNPSPGKAIEKGPKDEPGNHDHDKVADSEDKKGDPNHAPGEAKPSSTTIERNNPAPNAPPKMATNGPPPGAGRAGPKLGGGPAPAAVPPSPGGAGPASPQVVAGVNGGYTLNPENPGGDGKSRRAGKKRVTAFQNPVHPSATGFNQGGINLSRQAFENAVGPDKLKAERAADGAARRSAHRGSFEGNKFERWRAAIENYDPSVKPGNQTSLNAARVPFATYINAIHNRIHPIFAEEFLASLDSMPKGAAMAAADLVTHLEIVLSKDQGRIVHMGVTKASGVTAFDIVALDSVSRGQPFGKAPDAIVSPDGNVYLHWEFHRDPFDACSTRNASPFLLATAPKGAPKPVAPPRRGGMGAPRDENPVPGPLLPLRGR